MVKSKDTKLKKSKKVLESELKENQDKPEEVEQTEENLVGQQEEDKISNKKSRMSKLEKNIESMSNNTGVIYIGHLPWGFDEKGIKKYFQQFGPIIRIMVPKSRKVNKY
jgi:nucleolar protein 15